MDMAKWKDWKNIYGLLLGLVGKTAANTEALLWMLKNYEIVWNYELNMKKYEKNMYCKIWIVAGQLNERLETVW